MTWAAAIGAAGAVAGGLLSNKGKKKAAKLQKKALKYQIFSEQQARNDLAPWRQSGGQALNALNRAMGLRQVGLPQEQGLSVQQIYSGRYSPNGVTGGFNVMTPEVRAQLVSMGYMPPEADVGLGQTDTMEEDRYGGFYASPGYQFRMDEGIGALDKSAAARGRLRSGAQNKAITRYAQGVASDEFGNYTNRLSQMAGLGAGVAQNSAQNSLNSAANIGNSMVGIGNTRQSGYDAWAGVAENVGGMFGNALARRQPSGKKTDKGMYN